MNIFFVYEFYIYNFIVLYWLVYLFNYCFNKMYSLCCVSKNMVCRKGLFVQVKVYLVLGMLYIQTVYIPTNAVRDKSTCLPFFLCFTQQNVHVCIRNFVAACNHLACHLQNNYFTVSGLFYVLCDCPLYIFCPTFALHYKSLLILFVYPFLYFTGRPKKVGILYTGTQL